MKACQFCVLLSLLVASGLPRAVLAAPGDLDSNFGIGGKVTTDLNGSSGSLNDQAFALVIQADGKLIVGGRHGTFIQAQGLVDLDFALVRYNTDGALDGSFGSDGKVSTDFNGQTLDEISALVLQPDGKILAAGYCGAHGVAPGVINSCNEPGTRPTRTFALARYNVDGSLDASFGNGGKVTTSFRIGDIGTLDAVAYALALQPDGNIVAAGEVGGYPMSFAVIRYKPDGTLDAGFGTGGKVTTRLGTGPLGDHVLAVAVQADGRIIVAGYADFSVPSGDSVGNFGLVRYKADGTLDPTFGTGGKVIGGDGVGRALALQPDGKILLAGVSGNDFALERYNSDGSLDPTFGISGRVTTDFKCPPCGSDEAFALTLQPNSKILAAGYSNVFSNPRTRDFALVRYNQDGSLDVTFGNGGKVTTDFGAEEMASAVALQADGRIVVAGSRCAGSCLLAKSIFALARYEGGPPSLVAAVLPASRSVQVGTTATAFSTMIAVGPGVATSCRIAPATPVPATFLFQTTDPGTNVLTGNPNTPTDIPGGGGSQTFVVAFTPTASFAATEMQLTFDCTNTDPAANIPGVNTLLLSASASPVADIVALAATIDNNGIVNVVGGVGAFAVATVNVGVGASITTSADTGGASLPVAIALCQTNASTGQCLAAGGASVTTQINAGETPTFAIFVGASEAVPFDPAHSRIIVRFKDADGITRGATSVAVRTQ